MRRYLAAVLLAFLYGFTIYLLIPERPPSVFHGCVAGACIGVLVNLLVPRRSPET